jgi:hypothetical protein
MYVGKEPKLATTAKLKLELKETVITETNSGRDCLTFQEFIQ